MASWEAKNAHHDDDAGLVERAREGDRVAFEDLYRRHRNRIYALMWRVHAVTYPYSAEYRT